MVICEFKLILVNCHQPRVQRDVVDEVFLQQQKKPGVLETAEIEAVYSKCRSAAIQMSLASFGQRIQFATIYISNLSRQIQY